MLSWTLYLALIIFLIYWIEKPLRSNTNSLILKRNPGEQLEEWLKRFNWVNRSQMTQGLELPHYKFYSEVVEVLLSLARKMGGHYQEAILYLRDGLQADQQFEKKLRESVTGCWLQMFMILTLTWAFILASLGLVDVDVSLFKLGGIAIWQGIGLIMLPFLLRYFRHRLFADIGKIWKMLYVLSSLAKVPLSRSEIFGMAEIQELKNIRQRSLSHIVEKLKDTCQKALKMGGPYEEEIKYLMDELRFQEKWHMELFEKRLTIIKMGLLSLFFLPSYLAFIFMLLGDLMKIM